MTPANFAHPKRSDKAHTPATPTIPRLSLSALHRQFRDPPVHLQRNGKTIGLSRQRYRDAEGFFAGFVNGPSNTIEGQLYQAGVISDLALKAYLLNIGFDDGWCARQIGQRVAKALAYANAAGLGYACSETARFVEILSPYWKWNKLALTQFGRQDDGGFHLELIDPLLRGLLQHVRALASSG